MIVDMACNRNLEFIETWLFSNTYVVRYRVTGEFTPEDLMNAAHGATFQIVGDAKTWGWEWSEDEENVVEVYITMND